MRAVMDWVDAANVHSSHAGGRYQADGQVLDRRADGRSASEKEKVALGKIRRHCSRTSAHA
jgi:hypothetical protein